MTHREIIDEFYEELLRAEMKFKGWPEDEIHVAAIVCEEVGELIQAAIDYEYSGSNYTRNLAYRKMKNEAIQVGAMAIRFLKNL